MTNKEIKSITELADRLMAAHEETVKAIGKIINAVEDLTDRIGVLEREFMPGELKGKGFPLQDRDGLLPMQPIVRDRDGVARFRKNNLVRYLLDGGEINLWHLEKLPNIDRDDWTQFMQLIGYSVSGFSELHCVDPDVVAVANFVEGSLPKYSRSKA